MKESLGILLRDKYKNSNYEEFFTYVRELMDQVDEKTQNEIQDLVEIITG